MQGSLIKENLKLERTDEITGKVALKEVKETITLLKTELRKQKDIVCLCAPQIGKNLRLFVVKTNSNNYKEFLNPMVVSKSKEQHLSRERNISVSKKDYIIPRANEIHLAYQTYDGHITSESYKGPYAEVIQQMTEMLDGIQLDDYGLEVIPAFDKATDEEKTQVLQMYLDSLKTRKEKLFEEINANPELKQINDTIDFNIGLLNGTIKPVDGKGRTVEYEFDEKKGVVPKESKNDSSI